MASSSTVVPGHCTPRLDTRSWWKARRPPAEDLASRAAQYVRMSTDHQQYSTANQKDAIARYAREHGLEVVRTYADEGKSGLSARNRPGLCALLNDVAEARADFSTVLVYDVSRWGRFQDTDESAHYEFLCRCAGIKVEYCMEPFRNDGTPMSAVIKGLKRVMAGEYSRELSQKVFEGKCRGILRGFRQGGAAGYGLRRAVVDASGKLVRVLETGEHKYLQTDRIVQVLGPEHELKVVRWIFEQVADCGRNPTEIARDLNNLGVPFGPGTEWHRERVLHLVSNEKYIGNLVFNRSSTKLSSRRKRNPADQWVRVEGAFPAAVAPDLFRRAQALMATWSTRITNQAAIDRLRALFLKHGRLSQRLIDATPGLPSSGFYFHRFGGLFRAFELAGFTGHRDSRWVEHYAPRQRILANLRAEVDQKLQSRGATTARERKIVLVVNGQRLVMTLARHHSPDGRSRWLAQLHVKPPPRWVLVGRLNPEETAIQDYFLVQGGPQAFFFGGKVRRDKTRECADALDPLLDRIMRESDQAVP